MSSNAKATIPAKATVSEEEARERAQRHIAAVAEVLSHDPHFLGHLMETMLKTPAFIKALDRTMTHLRAVQAALEALPVELRDERNETTNLAVFRWPLNAPNHGGQIAFHTEVMGADESGAPKPVWQAVPEGFEVPSNAVAAVKAAIDDGSFAPGEFKFLEFICPPAPVAETDEVAVETAANEDVAAADVIVDGDSEVATEELPDATAADAEESEDVATE